MASSQRRLSPFDQARKSAAPNETQATTSGINETIDGSAFERWRPNSTYRAANLIFWVNESFWANESFVFSPGGAVGRARSGRAKCRINVH